MLTLYLLSHITLLDSIFVDTAINIEQLIMVRYMLIASGKLHHWRIQDFLDWRVSANNFIISQDFCRKLNEN